MDRFQTKKTTKELDSDDVLTDESSKRKMREEYEDSGEENFVRSKKIQRTPQKKMQQKEGEEGKLDMILEVMRDLKTEMKQIRIEQREYREDIKKLQVENRSLKEESNTLKGENTLIRAELKEIKNNMEILEKEKRKNNVVLTGLKMETSDPTTLKDEMRDFAKKHLKVEVEIKSVRKLGVKTCLVELENEYEKQKVMRNKSKLRELKEEKVFINDDITKKEQERQKAIRNMAKDEKDKGKEVKIGYKKLIIDGIEWRWNKEKEKLERGITKN